MDRVAVHLKHKHPKMLAPGIELLDKPRQALDAKNEPIPGMIEFHIKVTAKGKDVTPEAWRGPDGKPGHVRVHNPPTLVPDPKGGVVIEGRGRLRQDPTAVLAEIVKGLL